MMTPANSGEPHAIPGPDDPEAHKPSSVMIRGLSPEDVSRLAYACDVLAVHASSDDYRTWASTTAERLRALLRDLAAECGTTPGSRPERISMATAPTVEQQIAAVKAAARKVRELARGHYWSDPEQQVRRKAAARSIVIDMIGSDSGLAKDLAAKASVVAGGYSVNVHGFDIGPSDLKDIGPEAPGACPRCGSSTCEGGNWCDEPIPGDHYAGEDARVGSIEDLDPMAVER